MVKKFGSKQLTEVTIRGRKVLFSYKTPVVVFDGTNYLVTTQKFSVTTSKHISFYLSQEARGAGPYAAFNTVRVTQAELEAVINS